MPTLERPVSSFILWIFKWKCYGLTTQNPNWLVIKGLDRLGHRIPRAEGIPGVEEQLSQSRVVNLLAHVW